MRVGKVGPSVWMGGRRAGESASGADNDDWLCSHLAFSLV